MDLVFKVRLRTESQTGRIEAELTAAQGAYVAAQMQGGVSADRTAMARATRDLRFWSARRASAQLTEPVIKAGVMQFGRMVVIERADGWRQTFRIVGEDEADPKLGRLSYVSPLAHALLGKTVGDTVAVAGGEADRLAN